MSITQLRDPLAPAEKVTSQTLLGKKQAGVPITALTAYDYEHLVTYLRVLDAEADEADWTEVARIVLHIDPANEPARARHAWESHLARARWMSLPIEVRIRPAWVRGFEL